MEAFVRDKMDQGIEKDSMWRKCVKALNRKLWKLNAKNKEKAYEDDNDLTNEL